jgi:hypothetical protein
VIQAGVVERVQVMVVREGTGGCSSPTGSGTYIELCLLLSGLSGAYQHRQKLLRTEM